jgi:hypothetical protein
VVEDEVGVREYVRAALGQRGYVLLEAPDGSQALEVARNYPGEIHLLLTDVVMPHMRGPELARRIREIRPGLKVLYMSGYTDFPLEANLGQGEAMIQKPFSPGTIADRVRSMLD